MGRKLCDVSGRLEKVWHKAQLSATGVPSGSDVFSYSYLPNSYDLVESVTGPVHSVTNTWEPDRNVLDQKSNTLNASGTLISSYDYTVNAIGQRSNVAQTGTAFANSPTIDWTYDAMGQVVSADSSVTAQDRAYEYDGIGNRSAVAVLHLLLLSPPIVPIA